MPSAASWRPAPRSPSRRAAFDLAVGERALVRLEAQRALHQRLMLLEEQVVGVGPVDAADLVDVAETFGRDQRGPRAGPLQDRVDRDGRAVQEQSGIGIGGCGLLDPRGNALHEMVRRGERLAEAQPSGLVVEDRDIGERAADVGGQPKVRVSVAGSLA